MRAEKSVSGRRLFIRACTLAGTGALTAAVLPSTVAAAPKGDDNGLFVIGPIAGYTPISEPWFRC